MIPQLKLTWVEMAVGDALNSTRSISSELAIAILHSGDSSLLTSFKKIFY